MAILNSLLALTYKTNIGILCHYVKYISISVVLFPGQGIQEVGQITQQNLSHSSLEKFSIASNILGYDLLQICEVGPSEELNKTVGSICLSNFFHLNVGNLSGSYLCFRHLQVKWSFSAFFAI